MMEENVKIEIGKKIGDFFLDHMRNASKRLWIVSPWLSPQYVKMAIDKKKDGVDVKIITTNNYVVGHKEALKEIIEKKKDIVKKENRALTHLGKALIVLGLLGAIFSIFAIVLFVLGIALFLIGRERARVYFQAKIGDDNLIVYSFSAHPLHAKLYIADSKIMVGSANLTDAGLIKNTESMAIIENAELCEKIAEKIAKGQWAKRLTIEEIAREIKL